MLRTSHLVDWMRNNVGFDAEHRVHYGCGGKGAADLLGIERSTGRFVACEVKRPGQRPRPDQQRFLERVALSGGLAICARCAGDVLAVLASGGNG